MSKQIAIVTGATGGIGKEFVKELLREEVDEIWAIGRNKSKLAELTKEFGEKIKEISIDLSKVNELDILESLLQSEKPNVSFLVNNAGMAKMGEYNEFSNEEIEKTVSINCTAAVLMCNMCIPYMQSGSHILNISSAASFQPLPYLNLYSCTKTFLTYYSRSLNLELKSKKISVTAVCPGWVDTDLLEKERNGRPIKFKGLTTKEVVVKYAIKDSKKGKDMSICTAYVRGEYWMLKLFSQKVTMKSWLKQIRDYI